MPLFENSIGSFDFVSMSPTPPKRKRKLLIESRPGVDGFAVWQDAIRGMEYQPETVRDCLTFQDAIDLKHDYEDAVGGNPVVLKYADITFPNVIIVNVDAEAIAILNGIGGYEDNPQAIVRARWLLLIQ